MHMYIHTHTQAHTRAHTQRSSFDMCILVCTGYQVVTTNWMFFTLPDRSLCAVNEQELLNYIKPLK